MEIKQSSSKEGDDVKIVIIKRQLQTMAKSHSKAFALLIKLWLKGAQKQSTNANYDTKNQDALSIKSSKEANRESTNGINTQNLRDYAVGDVARILDEDT
ncbi:MAG: hypothetical protein ACTTJS_04530 [Wolinella sp.]